MVKSLLSAIHQALDLISNQKRKSTDLTFSVVAERLIAGAKPSLVLSQCLLLCSLIEPVPYQAIIF